MSLTWLNKSTITVRTGYTNFDLFLLRIKSARVKPELRAATCYKKQIYKYSPSSLVDSVDVGHVIYVMVDVTALAVFKGKGIDSFMDRILIVQHSIDVHV